MPIRQIIGSFEDIGKEIVRETARVPMDIAGITPIKPEKPQKNEPLPRNPRAALEYFAGKNKQKPKEPDVFEKQKTESEQLKNVRAQQKMAMDTSELKKVSTKRGRGDLFGVRAKQTAVERRTTGQD